MVARFWVRRARGWKYSEYSTTAMLVTTKGLKMTKFIRLLVLSIAVALVAAGCASSGDNASQTTTSTTVDTTDERGTALTLTVPQEPASWNYWEVAANALLVPTFYNVQETLLELKADRSIAPMLAESWEVSEDGRTVTFVIREAKFHDGSSLDSADVVYSLNKNAESPLSKLSAVYGNVEKVEATDDRTVVVTLIEQSASFLEEMTQSAGVIVPEGSHEALDLATEMPGTGPFVFGEYKPDTSLTMTRFADYWGELPYFTDVTWLFIADETAALNGLKSGQYDSVTSVLGEGLDRVATFESDPDFQVVIEQGAKISYVFMNVNMPELQDIRVRQAIAHAIDRKPIIDAGVVGFGDPTCLMVVPYAAAYNSDYCPYEYNPERARQLLAEAGQENLVLDYPFVNVASHPIVMEILKAQLADVGITAETRSEDLATWLDRTFTQGMYEFSQITDTAPISQYGCEGGREPLGKSSQLCIPEFEDLLAASDQTTDYDEYISNMAELVNTFADLAWVTVLFAPTTPQLARADLAGIQEVRNNSAFDLRPLRWSS